MSLIGILSAGCLHFVRFIRLLAYSRNRRFQKLFILFLTIQKQASGSCPFQSSLTTRKGKSAQSEVVERQLTFALNFLTDLSQKPRIAEAFCFKQDGSKQILSEAGRIKAEQGFFVCFSWSSESERNK